MYTVFFKVLLIHQSQWSTILACPRLAFLLLLGFFNKGDMIYERDYYFEKFVFDVSILMFSFYICVRAEFVELTITVSPVKRNIKYVY